MLASTTVVAFVVTALVFDPEQRLIARRQGRQR
jgi:hypothetical protein